MGLPQIIWLFLITLNLGMSLASHGEPEKNHNCIYTIIGTVASGSILYWGGFFSGN